MAARDYPAMMRMVTDGTLRPARLTGDVIGLEGVPQALAAMDRPAAAAGMVVAKLTG
jgi:alcohol dehydrogenase